FLVHDDRLHLGRCHRVDHELGRVLVPQDDVDALAVEVVRHRLHARTAHADAGADRIGAAVVRQHRDLGAVAGIARATLDLDQALADFGHFQLEQLDHELRCRARHEQLRPAHFGFHFVKVATHAVANTRGLARDGLVARNERLGVAAQVEIDVAALDPLHDAGHQLADAIGKGVHHLLALGLAYALHDHLLGGLRGDATEFGVLDLLLDVLADLGVRALVQRVHQAQLVGRRFHLAVVGNDFPAPEGFVLAGVVIDRHADIRLFVRIALLRRRRQRGFHRLEDHLFRHALFIGDRVDDQQKLFAHCSNSVSILSGYRWLNWCVHSGTQTWNAAMDGRTELLFAAGLGLRRVTQRHPVRHHAGTLHQGVSELECPALAFQRDLSVPYRDQFSAQATASFQWRFQQHFHFLSGGLFELSRREQRPIDARRGHFQHVMTGNRIFHVEQCGELSTGLLAVLDAHFATLRIDTRVRRILVQQLQVNAQGTLPLRRGELHAEAFQAQIGQYLAETLCQCLCIHQLTRTGSRKQKMGSNGPFPYLADVPPRA